MKIASRHMNQVDKVTGRNAESEQSHLPLQVGRGAPVLLPKGRHCWCSDGGRIEIFLQTGRGRQLLAVVAHGGHVLSLPEKASGEFVAVGEPGTCLVDTAGITVYAVEDWVRAVGETIVPLKTDEAPQQIPPAETLEAGQWVYAARGAMFWISAERLRWCGLDAIAGAALLPVAGNFCGMALEKGQILSSDTLEDQGLLEQAVSLFNTELCSTVDSFRATSDSRTLAGLVDENLDRSQVKLSVQVVAASLGVELKTALPPRRDRYADAPNLLRRAKLRQRRIRLSAGWSGQDVGPIIVEDGESSVATTLIWSRGLYRREDGRTIGLQDEANFGQYALSVHAPLPDRIIGLFSLARYLLPTLRRDSGWVIAAGAGISIVGVMTPLATGWIYAGVVPGGLATTLIAIGLALLAGAFVTASFTAARSLALQRISGRTGLSTAAAVADKVLRLPPSFFRDHSAGDLNQRIAAIDQLRELVTGVMISSTLTLVFSIFYFATLMIFDVGLALLSAGLVSIHIIATFVARALQLRHVRINAELEGQVSGAGFETLSAIGKLRVAAAEERALRRWGELYAAKREAQLRMGRIGAQFAAFTDAYQTVTMMVLFGVAAILTADDMPAGVFIGFLIAFGSFQGAVTGFCDGLMSLFSAQPLVERARPIFTADAETAEYRTDPGRLTGAIDLSGVSFSYPGGRPLLEALDLSIQAGEHVAIVGESGSGKSTILRLLLGFETPKQGSIMYEGKDLSRLDLGSLRGQIGVVLQSSQLFAGSILDNIRGASDVGLQACLEAADRAALGPDLAQFPMGLHTPITDGAAALSGGQRQRILIARALVDARPVLFLDEATSALDNATQSVVINALEQSSATRLVIAHRLSTVRLADRICVLKDGRFVETGTYEELLELNGVFAELAKRQLLDG